MARPVIAASTPSPATAQSARMSSRFRTPPEAITGTESARARPAVASTFTPLIIPSRRMSVKTNASTPSPSNCRARSKRSWLDNLDHPSTASLPSLASSPTMMCAGNSAHRSATKCGTAIAFVPRMTNRTPAWMYASTVSSSRMPPPTWTGTSGWASTMAWMMSAFFGSPATAPSRSTTWIRRAPASTQRDAIATGSSENTVAVSMRPSRRRTHLRSLMSMAGMTSMSLASPAAPCMPRRQAALPCRKY